MENLNGNAVDGFERVNHFIGNFDPREVYSGLNIFYFKF